MDNTYFDGTTNVCPDCSYEWSENEAQEHVEVAKDSNGALLEDGDSVTVIKDLKVKGSSMVIKRGTKVKSIRLTENPEEVDCKIDGSSIVLKTCFLKK
jgi:protein PhnA